VDTRPGASLGRGRGRKLYGSFDQKFPYNRKRDTELTPVARLIFDTKNPAIFLERFFGRGISGAALLPYNCVPINWLWSGFIFPELEHL